MSIIGTVSTVLSHKQHTEDIFVISPDATVFEAIRIMAEKNVGALLVMREGQLLGIVSERDYTRKVALRGRSSKETLVREITSEHLHTATPEYAVEECMRLMTIHRIRHLPVIQEGKVIGVVSVGDLINWIISTQSQVINQLSSYIQGHISA